MLTIFLISSPSRYKLKIRRGDEKATDFIIEDKKSEPGNIVQYRIPLDLELGSEYKVNIYSQVVRGQTEIESEPLFMKVTKSEEEGEEEENDDSIENDPRDVFDAKETGAGQQKRRRTTSINLYRTKTHGHGDNLRLQSPNHQHGITSPTEASKEVPLTPAIIKQVNPNFELLPILYFW